MQQNLMVFISSTADLINYRDAVENALNTLNINGSRFETWPPTPKLGGGMSECLRRLEESDAVVLLLGKNYGTIIENGMSATHLEYRHARQHKKPIFVFILHAAERVEQQTLFIGEVEKDYFRGSVIESVEKLKLLVRDAFLQEFTRCFRDVHFGTLKTNLKTQYSAPSSAIVSQPLSLNDDPTLAYEELEELYERKKDDLIRKLAPQIELRFSANPEIMGILYMAEINYGIRGGTAVHERLEKAVSLWDESEVRKRYTSYSLNYNQGNALSLLKRYQEAIVKYKLALSQQPDFAPCWKNLGTTYIDIGERELAKHAFQQAIAYEPHLFEARYSLATLAIEEWAYTDALNHLSKIRLEELADTQKSYVYGRLSMTLGHLNNHRAAIKAIESAIAFAPDAEWPWLLGGRIHAIACRVDRQFLNIVRAFGERLVSRFPERGETWGELGYTYWMLRQEQPNKELTQKCITAFSKAIEFGFLDGGLIPDRLGHLYTDSHELLLAESAFRLAAEQNTSLYGYCLGMNLLSLERYNDALPLLEAAAEKYQPDAMSWSNVALCHSRLGERKKAIECYKKAIEKDSTYAEAWFNLGGMYWNEGNFLKAISLWQTALAKFPYHELAEKVKMQFLSIEHN